MTNLALTEDVLDAFIDKLKTGLTARIASINNEVADDVTVATPLEQDFYLGGAANIPGGRTPALIVTDGGTGESGGFTEEGPHSLNYSFAIVCFMLDEDSDRNRLARKLLRLERAVIETIWDDPVREQLTISDHNHPHVWPSRIQPGPVFNPENEGEPYRQWRAVVFDVQTYA